MRRFYLTFCYMFSSLLALLHIGHSDRLNNQCNHSFKLFPLTPNQTHGALQIGQRIAAHPNIKLIMPMIMPVGTKLITSSLLSRLARPTNMIMPPHTIPQNARLAFHHWLVFLIIESLNIIFFDTHNAYISHAVFAAAAFSY